MDAAYRTQRGLFMPAEVERIAGPALRDRWAPTIARVAAAEAALFDGGASTLEGDVARLETRVYLGSQLLRDLDVMSMAHGLEVRVPFVDHVLLEAVWPDLGAHPSLMRNKRLLHETLARPLPREAVDRPKQGFTLPFAQWMDGGPAAVRPLGHGAISPTRAGSRPDVPDATWRAWQRGAAHWSRPWALGVLGEFLRHDVTDADARRRRALVVRASPRLRRGRGTRSLDGSRRERWVRATLPPLLSPAAAPAGAVLDVGCARAAVPAAHRIERPALRRHGRRAEQRALGRHPEHARRRAVAARAVSRWSSAPRCSSTSPTSTRRSPACAA